MAAERRAMIMSSAASTGIIPRKTITQIMRASRASAPSARAGAGSSAPSPASPDRVNMPLGAGEGGTKPTNHLARFSDPQLILDVFPDLVGARQIVSSTD